MGRLIKYKITDDTGLKIYRILDTESGKMRDVNSEFIQKNHLHLVSEGLDFDNITEIHVKDIEKYRGHLKLGLNDFDTYCRLNDKFSLLAEYSAGNNPKKPTEIAKGALDNVTWICNKCKHKWETPIKSRTHKTKKYAASGCPMCQFKAGKYKILVTGENDLYTWCVKNNRQNLLSEYSSSNRFDTKDVSAKNSERVKWVCNKCKKVFYNSIGNRTDKNQGCPSCANNGTSIPELIIYLYMSELFSEVKHRAKVVGIEADVYIKYLNLVIDYRGEYWHSKEDAMARDLYKELILNNTNTPFVVILENSVSNAISDKNIEYNRNSKYETLIEMILAWINKVYGLKYELDLNMIRQVEETAIAMKNTKTVPNSIVKTHPEVAERWDSEKNETFRPESVTRGCKYKAWFKCDKCKQSYYSFIRKQADGQGCPICSGNKVVTGYNDFKTTCVDQLGNWNYERNDELGIFPHLVKDGSNKRVYWKCCNCGFETFESIGVKTGYGVKTKAHRCMNCENKGTSRTSQVGTTSTRI